MKKRDQKFRKPGRSVMDAMGRTRPVIETISENGVYVVPESVTTDGSVMAAALALSERGKGAAARLELVRQGIYVTGHGTHLCACCGSEYRHRTMADRCTVTSRCRMLHAPGRKRWQKWAEQACVLELALQLGAGLVEEPCSSEGDIARGKALCDAAGYGFKHIQEYSIASSAGPLRLMRGFRDDGRAFFGGRGARVAVWPLAAATLDLAEELSVRYAEEFGREVAEGKRTDGREAWDAVLTCLGEICDDAMPTYVPADGDKSWKDIRNFFHAHVFGRPAPPPKPSFYEFDGYVYASHGREELRRFIEESEGRKAVGHIVGISPSEVLEGGMTMLSVLGEGADVPCRVALLG